MSYYVQRRRESDGKQGWTGPIRSFTQSMREVMAWRDAGWEACALEATPEVKKMVREWEKAKKANES